MATQPLSATSRETAANQTNYGRQFWAGQWNSMGIEPLGADASSNDRDVLQLNLVLPFRSAEGMVAQLGCGSARLLARIGLERPKLQRIALHNEASALDLVQASGRVNGVPLVTQPTR